METSLKPTQQLHDQGQRLWLDNLTRGMLQDGTLSHYIRDFSVTGLTSNPTIFDKAIKDSDLYDDSIAAAKDGTDEEIFFDVALEDLRAAAQLFKPIHDRTAGIDGWVSLEVSPGLAADAPGTIRQATSLHRRADRPNLYVKVPGTPEGVVAIEELIFSGVHVNVTLLFSAAQYAAAASAYERGIARRVAAGLHPGISSVASLFVSRWDKAVADKVPSELRNLLGIAIAKLTYKAYRERLADPGWQRLEDVGARPQRLLWASTGTKDPSAPDVLYVEALAAPGTINTMPDETLRAFADHGKVTTMLAADGGDADEVLARFCAAGVDVDALAVQLQREGAESFVKSWTDLMQQVASKRKAMRAKSAA
jgi:transaldolase